MKFALWFHSIWSIILALFLGMRFLGLPYGAYILGGLLIYVVVSFLSVMRFRWALAIVWIVPYILMLRFLPMVLYNLAMFVFGHPLYQDSPATILVVLVTAIVFAIPATVVSAFFVRYYKDMVSIVCGKPFQSLGRSGHLIAKSFFYSLLAGAAVIFCVSFYLLHQNSPTWDSDRYWQEQLKEKNDY